MACLQTLYGIQSDCQPSKGGIKQIYISPRQSELTVTVEDGVITSFSDGSHGGGGVGDFAKFDVRKNTSSMVSTLNIDNSNGTNYVQTDLTLTFPRMDTAKRIELQKLINSNNIAVMVQDSNDVWWYLGKDYAVTVTASNGQTGTQKGDANNYTVTLTDFSKDFPIQSTVLPWETRPTPSFMYEILLYKTYDEDVTDQSKWQRDSEMLSGDGDYEYNQNCELDCFVETGFLGWYNGETGTLLSTSNPYSFNVKRSIEIIAKIDGGLNKPIYGETDPRG